MSLYPIGRAQALEQLRKFDFTSFMRACIAQVCGAVDGSLMELQITVNNFVSGQEKNRLTQWWLSRIEGDAKAWLQEKNFVSGAMSEDYIEEPPEDMELIRSNLEVVQSVLHKQNDEQLNEFIEKLCAELYPRVDEYIEEGRTVLAHQFDLDKQNMDLQSLEEQVTQARDTLDPAVFNLLMGTIKDLIYLEKMKELEVEKANDNEGRPQNRIGDVVPLSGLILNVFFRLEQEHRTVIEIWKHRDKRSILQEQQQKALAALQDSKLTAKKSKTKLRFLKKDKKKDSSSPSMGTLPGSEEKLAEREKHTLLPSAEKKNSKGSTDNARQGMVSKRRTKDHGADARNRANTDVFFTSALYEESSPPALTGSTAGIPKGRRPLPSSSSSDVKKFHEGRDMDGVSGEERGSGNVPSSLGRSDETLPEREKSGNALSPSVSAALPLTPRSPVNTRKTLADSLSANSSSAIVSTTNSASDSTDDVYDSEDDDTSDFSESTCDSPSALPREGSGRNVELLKPLPDENMIAQGKATSPQPTEGLLRGIPKGKPSTRRKGGGRGVAVGRPLMKSLSSAKGMQITPCSPPGMQPNSARNYPVEPSILKGIKPQREKMLTTIHMETVQRKSLNGMKICTNCCDSGLQPCVGCLNCMLPFCETCQAAPPSINSCKMGMRRHVYDIDIGRSTSMISADMLYEQSSSIQPKRTKAAPAPSQLSSMSLGISSTESSSTFTPRDDTRSQEKNRSPASGTLGLFTEFTDYSESSAPRTPEKLPSPRTTGGSTEDEDTNNGRDSSLSEVEEVRTPPSTISSVKPGPVMKASGHGMTESAPTTPQTSAKGRRLRSSSARKADISKREEGEFAPMSPSFTFAARKRRQLKTMSTMLTSSPKTPSSSSSSGCNSSKAEDALSKRRKSMQVASPVTSPLSASPSNAEKLRFWKKRKSRPASSMGLPGAVSLHQSYSELPSLDS
mgnify:CR=1 FL=1